jgi:hypothetical protein
MHRLVFEYSEHGLGAIEQRVTRSFNLRGRERVEDLSIGLCGEC